MVVSSETAFLSKLNKLSKIETYSSAYTEDVDELSADFNDVSEPERDLKLLKLRSLLLLFGSVRELLLPIDLVLRKEVGIGIFDDRC